MHVTRLPRWAVERGGVLNSFPELERGKTALVNIDMQSVFLDEDQIYGNRHSRDIVGAVNGLSAAMRAIGAPVIWTRQTHTYDGPCAPPPWQYDPAKPGVAEGIAALQAGAPGHGLYPAMQVADSDIVVLITGTLTNCCCETTAREANLAGYKVIVVADATATLTDAEHNAALLNLRLNFADVRRAKTVLSMIRACAAHV